MNFVILHKLYIITSISLFILKILILTFLLARGPYHLAEGYESLYHGAASVRRPSGVNFFL